MTKLPASALKSKGFKADGAEQLADAINGWTASKPKAEILGLPQYQVCGNSGSHSAIVFYVELQEPMSPPDPGM